MARRPKVDPTVAAATAFAQALAAQATKQATAGDTATAKRLGNVRADAWQNVYSGMGIQGRDRSMSTTFAQRERLTSTQCGVLYRQNWLAKRLVDDICSDSVRAGFVLEVTDDPDTSEGGTPERMYAAWKALHLFERLREGLRWALVYGGGAGQFYTDDPAPTGGALQGVVGSGLMLADELPKGANLKQIIVVDSRYAIPDLTRYTTDLDSPNFGNPDVTLITPYGFSSFVTPQRTHWSRMLRFEGIPTDAVTRLANLTWGDSIYEAAWDPLQRYGSAFQGAATLVSEFSQKVLKMKGLADLMAGDQASAILGRVLGVRMGLDVTGIALVDADSEELTRLTAQVAGLRDLLDSFRAEVLGSTRLLKSRVYGGEQGELASGQSDALTWASYVAGWQDHAIVPNLERVTRLIFGSSDWAASGGKVPKRWSIKPNPITPPDLDAEVVRRKTQAEIDKIYWEVGALEKSETRKSRFGGAKYSHETTLDPEFTAALEEIDKRNVGNEAAEPPPAEQ